MVPPPLVEIADHGGSLGRASVRYPDAPRPWLDLSTGINACSYPVPPIPASAWSRLPEEADLHRLADRAAETYGAPSGAHVVCAPGTQVLLPLVASLIAPGKAAVLSPTYAEHRRAAALAGHDVAEVSDPDRLGDADLAVVVNPNNPDGRLSLRRDLLDLAAGLRRRSGLLVVDEAFMDAVPQAERIDGDVGAGGLVALRSFGKFFGLAGVRLGFAIGPVDMMQRLRARLGPWAVSGPAIEIGCRALADRDWQKAMRIDLSERAARLDAVLDEAGLVVTGGTPLYRFVRHDAAPSIVAALGRLGILVREFDFDPTALRFGVPAADTDFDRLKSALPG